MQEDIYWDLVNVSQGSMQLVNLLPGRELVVQYNGQREDLKTNVYFTSPTYTYPYDPPYSFNFGFRLIGENVKDVRYNVRLFLVSPSGKTWHIWPYRPWSQHVPSDQEKSLLVHGESSDYWLNVALGLDAGNENLANMTFTEPGEYNFILHLNFSPEAERATCKIIVIDTTFIIPGLLHGILGTDNAGGDIFSQLVYGSRISLEIGLLAAAISTSLGILIGIIAGYMGGLVDELTMRVVDILLCLPVLPLLLALVFLFGKSVWYIVLLIAVFGWQGLSRLVRSLVLSLRETAFIECARASGASRFYIMTKHLIPNVLPVAFASLVLSVPSAILTEASLSFLGFGDPASPTWGRMLQQAFGFGAFKALAWWWIIPPGLALTALCLSFVFMGHAVDEIVNPRLRRRR
jgi:ABC-type dipeptide/oligopeptide/nickel transport system permease subunit